MDLGPLRALVRDLNFAAHGFPITVTRPYPDDEAIETRGIWVLPLTVDGPSQQEFTRRDPNRVIALRKDEVETVPRGTIIDAPEYSGGTARRWRVEGPERIEADHVRVLVVADPEPY